MTEEQMRRAAGFAAGLGVLKAKQELGEGAQLTPDEVAGLIWGIKQLRGGRDRGATHHPAER